MELTKEDIFLAETGKRTLQKSINKNLVKPNVRLKIGSGNDEINLPPQAVRVLAEALEQISQGKDVTVTAQPVEMTTQQAADFLRVSRPFVVGLLDKGEIPSRKVGTHRRVLLTDLQTYKEQIDDKRLESIEQLTAQAQELNMGY